MIPLSIPNIGDSEAARVAEALKDGWISTSGPAVKQFETALADYCGSRFCVVTNSGTSAIHLALLVHGVGSDQFVIAPNLTFVATLNPIRYVGATPILVDCEPDTWQMDLALVRAFLEEQTEMRDGKCIHVESGKWVSTLLPTHVLGYPCDLEGLLELAAHYQLTLIEDASEAVGSRMNGKALGTFGEMACLSFNGNKILSTGAGGAVLTEDQAKAEHVRHLAWQAKRHPEEYLHDEVGYNYGMSNLSAALGLAQLERMEEFLARKTAIDRRYREALAGLGDIGFLTYPDGASPNHWLSTIQSRSARILEEVLFNKGVQTRKLWLPMNRLPMYRDCMYLSASDHSHHIYEHSLSLPCSTGLSDADQAQVIEALRSFFGNV